MSKISVIIPVHNTQDYFPKCMESVLGQTMHDIEIILVENASTDNSLELCHKYAASDSRVKVIHSDVGDLSSARNAGLDLATSEYVSFLDSDDTIEPETYETLYGFLKSNNLDLVYFNHVQIFDDRPPKYTFRETGDAIVLTPKRLLMKQFMHKAPVHACTMVVRRKLFDNLRFPEFMYYEDRAFTYLLINSCQKVGYIDKAFYNYYQRSGSIVHTRSWKHYYDYAHAERKRLEFIIHSDLFTSAEKKRVSKYIAEGFLSKLRSANKMAASKHEKKLSRKMVKSISMIPKGCKLRMKSRMYKLFIKARY